MAMLACAEHSLVLGEYTPLAVKQAVVGYGRASKLQIQDMVKRQLHLPETACEDASDALAIALTHALALVVPESAAPLFADRTRTGSWRQWRPA